MKSKTFEDATSALEAKKAELSSKREEMEALRKEYKLKKGQAPEDAKALKGYTKLKGEISALKEAKELLEAETKALKPKKERALKYEYPEGLSDIEKKRYRAKMRKPKNEEGDEATEAKAKKKAKKVKTEEGDEATEAKAKKVKTEEAAEVAEKSPKKAKKKAKKEEAPEANED